MQRNTTLIAGLMLVLALGAGWVLFGSQGGLSSSVGDSSRAESDDAGGPLGAPSLGPETPAEEAAPTGRAPVEVIPPAVAQAGLELVAPDQTEVIGRTVDLTGMPVGGASLELWATTRRVERPSDAEGFATHLEATSGPDGRFHLKGIASHGTYLYLTAAAPGAARAELFGFDARPGRVRDIGDVQLAPPMTLFGVVLDDHDEPIGDASLWLSKGALSSRGMRGVAEPAGFADGTGRFQLTGLGAGSYVIGAEAPGRAMTFSDVVSLDPGGLPPGEETLRLPEGCTLRGRVVDATRGTGVGGADLLLLPSNVNNAQYLAVMSDANGGFQFAGLGTRARLSVEAKKEGYLPASRNLRPASATAGQIEERVEMHSARSLTLTVRDDASGEPVPGAIISGSGNNPPALRAATQAGFTATSGTAPLATTNELGHASVPLAREDPWLTVTAEGYAPQTVDATPRVPRDPSKAEDAQLEVRLKRGASLVVRVTAKERPQVGAVVELRLASSSSFEGEVLDPMGGFQDRPGRNRRPQRRRVDQELLWRDEASMTPVARQVTDELGEVLFAGLPEGSYFVDVTADSETLQASLFGPVSVSEDSERVKFAVALAPAATIQGWVQDRGTPAAGHRVIAIQSFDKEPVTPGRALPQAAEQLSTVTDAEGNFHFDHLAPGAWKLVSFRPMSLGNQLDPVHGQAALSYQMQERSLVVELAVGETREVELGAQTAGARLRGRVLVNHEPRADVLVSGSFRDREGNRQDFRARTDATGRYEAEALLPGTWSLGASIDGSQSDSWRPYGSLITVARGTLEVPDEPEVHFDVDVEVGSVAVQLGVEDPELPAGEEAKELSDVSRVSINLASDPGAGGVTGLLDGNVTNAWFAVGQRLTLENLPVGSYLATLSAYGAKTKTIQLRVAPGIEKTIETNLVRLPKDELPTSYWSQ